MIIQDIEIRNFRGIQHLKLSDFATINLLFGANNIGKTTILESLFLTIGMSNPNLALNIDTFRNLSHTEGDDFRFLFHKLNYSNKPSFNASFYDREVRSLELIANLRLPGTSKIVSTSGSNQDGLNSMEAESLVFDFFSKVPHSQRENQKSTIRFIDGQFEMTPPKSYKEGRRGIFMNASYSHLRDLNERLENLILEKRKAEIIDGLKLIDPRIIDISVGRNQMIFLDIEGFDRLIPSNLQGSGMNRLIGTIINIHSIRNGVLLIDEIENGFHYKMLSRIWVTLIKACKHYNVQLFVSTHNYEVLAELKTAMESITNVDTSIKGFKIVKNQEGNLEGITYESSQFINAIETDLEIR